ncbi:hypothetical protein DPMN_194582 [Dreissena polymorpha]|uniref:Uncharacterized protein n=1 Tax=Dreissena polymorpha TaxID=45954 RepID=A0A9D4BF61_DREPO|nr:hypothetical protein DPMN_194582 [Dreissena polymorpha]
MMRMSLIKLERRVNQMMLMMLTWLISMRRRRRRIMLERMLKTLKNHQLIPHLKIKVIQRQKQKMVLMLHLVNQVKRAETKNLVLLKRKKNGKNLLTE